jgi:hypothetical protein
MNLMKQSLRLLAFSAGVLFVNGANPRGTVHARAAAHSFATNAGETTQAKIARAMSAAARGEQRFHMHAGKPRSCWGTTYVCRCAFDAVVC